MAPLTSFWFLHHGARGALLYVIFAAQLAMPTLGDSSPAGATCKQGYTLYNNTAQSIVGCYKLFSSKLTWNQAKAYCADDSYYGPNAMLAAARTQGEFDFLESLVGLSRYWVSGSNLENDHIWRWVGYSQTVSFNTYAVPQTSSYNQAAYYNRVILAGAKNSYDWSFELPNNETHYFVCRKQACVPSEDVYGGICTPSAASVAKSSSSSNLAWIAGAAIGGVLLLLLIVLLLLYLFKRTAFDRVIGFFSCKRKSNKIADTSSSSLSHHSELGSAGESLERKISRSSMKSSQRSLIMVTSSGGNDPTVMSHLSGPSDRKSENFAVNAGYLGGAPISQSSPYNNNRSSMVHQGVLGLPPINFKKQPNLIRNPNQQAMPAPPLVMPSIRQHRISDNGSNLPMPIVHSPPRESNF